MEETAQTAHGGYLQSIARAAAPAVARVQSARSASERVRAAQTIDALLVRVARGRGALDIAIGERLDALHVRGHALRLGYATVGEYVRERLGDSPSSAQKLARFSRALRERPLLRAAVREGHVTRRQAEAVLAVARGDAEALWVDRARISTVRALKEAVDAPECADDDEAWRLFVAEIPEDYQEDVAAVMRQTHGPLTAATIRADRVLAICQETLGELAPYSDESCECEPLELDAAPLEKSLEQATAQWAFLDRPEAIAAPGPSADFDADARQLDAELRGYCALREQWDEHLGGLAKAFRSIDGWRWIGFASFEHYCTERLGMHPKTIRQRAALERQLEALPSLAEARRSGAVSYEKARLIALFAADSPDPWIERARSLPCSALRRLLQAEEDRKMCARRAFRAFLPRAVQLLLAQACAALRRAVARPLSAGECFGMMCRRFRQVWAEPRGRNTVQARVRDRDGGLCQVPGCSRAAAHVHHVVYRSHGGSDHQENLVSLCHAHHHAVHMGWIRVWGRAPSELHWQLGVRPGLPPLIEYHPGAEAIAA